MPLIQQTMKEISITYYNKANSQSKTIVRSEAFSSARVPADVVGELVFASKWLHLQYSSMAFADILKELHAAEESFNSPG